MKIFFLENSTIEYDSNDRYANKLRGGETVLINLAENLTNFDHEIHVFNKCKHRKEKINKVYWSNIDLLREENINKYCDIAIAQADANMFKLVNSKKNFLLSHSVQNFEKFIRKKQLLPFAKYKPKVIVAGDYHYNTRKYFTSFYGKIKLFWSVDKMFSESSIDNSIVKNKAIFTTRADRNLKLLLDIWNNMIYPYSKNSTLHINPPYKLKSNDINVKLRELGNQQNLLDDLKTSRVMLVPGHKGEVFCLAAQEALEMCIPIVTLGIGALAERVDHNKTGFIAKNKEEFARYSLTLLKDDKKWNVMRNNLLEKRGKISWLDAAKKLNLYLADE